MSSHSPQEVQTRPMNIFVSFPINPLTDHLPNGDGLLAFHFIRSMAERGHQLHVATTRAKISNPLPPNVHVYEKAHALDCSQPRALSYLLWSRSVLAHVCRRRQIDLIHELNPVRSLCSLAFAGSSIPVILGPHSSRWPASTAQLRLPARIRQETKAVFKDIIVRQQHRRACAILLSTPAALNNISLPDELRAAFDLRHQYWRAGVPSG